MTDQLSHELLAQNLHGRFKIHQSTDNVVEVDLVEVSEFKKSDFQERFWIVFRGPGSNPLPQGTYLFENENIGRFDIFITPMRHDSESLYYEAVFNRLVLPEGPANV